MDSHNRKVHWENVFQTKDTTKVSWYQSCPTLSLTLIEELKLTKNAQIIDVGAGDGFLADNLLKLGYTAISILDISKHALSTTKTRLSKYADKINFIVADICHFSKANTFDIWHDRAVFHFLTSEEERRAYLKNVRSSLKPEGFFIIGTFSKNGPTECSGLAVQQYTQEELCLYFAPYFKAIKCFPHQHTTPLGSIQNFVFCVFQSKGVTID